MNRRLARISALWAWIARRRWLSIGLSAAIPLMGRLLLLPIQPIPVPAVHDEFSYLLAAETFAKGRLTNPTPPMWEHFETFHVLMQPTYMSVYPPGQGAALALSLILFGHAWWMVWLSVGLMCGALTWMLQAWLPPRWALLGGVLAAFQFGFLHYWMNAYWGGSIAATGGCLVLGAFPRMQRQLRIGYSLVLAAGLVLLAATRPFEGFVLSLVVGGAMVLWLVHQSAAFRRQFIWKAAVPVAMVMIPAGILMAMQNQAITGSPFRFPHEVYRRQVAVWPTFVFQDTRPEAVYRHEVLRKFFVEWEPGYEDAKDWGTLKGLLPGIEGRFRTVGASYFPHAAYLPIALLSLTAIPFSRTRLLGVCIVAAFSCTAIVNWLVPHYLAPILAAMIAIHLQFLRFLRAWKWKGRRVGRRLFAGVLGLLLALFAVRFGQRIRPDQQHWALARDRFVRQLQGTPGAHLVFVRYSPRHSLNDEWVFNAPDIPAAKVIWARTMAPELDAELADYYRGRVLWTLDADADPPTLTPRAGRFDAPGHGAQAVGLSRSGLPGVVR